MSGYVGAEPSRDAADAGGAAAPPGDHRRPREAGGGTARGWLGGRWRSDVTLTGVALHSGVTSSVTCRPSSTAQGITFSQRGARSSAVPARPHHVGATERRTGLGEGDNAIYTVEHLLAAAFALGLDDLAVEVDGPELPILDGSFEPWLEALASGGVAEVPGTPVTYRVRAPFALKEGGASYRVEPADEFRLTVSVEWDHPVIGRQTGEWAVDAASFGREIAGARTFGFEREVAELRSRGFALGGAVENVIVLSDDGVVGTTLRWPDEFVRHKAGDVIGDIALIGGRLKAHIFADRPESPGKRGAGPAPDSHGGTSGRTRARDQRDHGHPAAPVPVPPRRSHHRRGEGAPGGRHQERDDQRAVLPGPFSRAPDHAGRADRRGAGPGGLRAAHGQADRSRRSRSRTSWRSTT